MKSQYLLIILLILRIFYATDGAANTVTKPLLKLSITGSNSSLNSKIENFKKKIIQDTSNLDPENNLEYLSNEYKIFLEKYLKSLGYYANIVTCNEENKNNIHCFIKPGEQYIIGSIKIINSSASATTPFILPPIDKLEVKIGKTAISKDILYAQQKLEEFIEENNCLLTLNVAHQAVIKDINNSVDIEYIVEAGPTTSVNNIFFEGLETFKPAYVFSLLSLKSYDECFKNSKLLEAKNTLLKSGLFVGAKPTIVKVPGQKDKVDIIFKLKEHKHRTVKVGLKYSTDLGLGINTSFAHRNLFGQGEKIHTALNASRILQSIDTVFEKTLILKYESKFKLQHMLKKEDSEAFDNKETFLLTMLETKLSPSVTLGTGVKYGVNRVATNETKNYALLSLPLYLISDFRDEIIDPKKGSLFKLEITPYFNTIYDDEKFLKKQFSVFTYYPLNTKFTPIWATKIIVGSISGISAQDTPPTEKFFAGGSQSIRGYSYQRAGPLTSKKKPAGGNSLFEASTELRLRIYESFGITPFIDIGNIFPQKTPKFKERMFMSVGVGLRYYTSFGPLRADIAFPLKKRHKIDRAFQLYFSIGQSF